MRALSGDFETRGRVDLTTVGAHVYARHPMTRALCFNYSFDKGKTVQRWQIWRGHPMPKDLREALDDPDCFIEAWHASFERLIFNHVLKIALPIRRFKCTMSRARSMALPGKLELCAKALSMPVQKADNSIMRRWMKPLPDGTWAQDEAEYDELLHYCDIDVQTEAGIGQVVRDLTADEWEDYWTNEEINDRGLPIDVDLARAAQQYAKDELHEICQRLNVLTHGSVTTPKQFKRIKEWLADFLPDEVYEELFLDEDGDEKEKVSFDAAAREELLSDDNADIVIGDVREFIELIDDGGRASTAKFVAMQARAANKARAYGSYIFSGAGQTGRYSSAGVQFHNLIRDKIENIEAVVEAILKGVPKKELQDIASYRPDGTFVFDRSKDKQLDEPYNILTILSRTLKAAIIADEGKTFVWGDWKSIEAVVNPWLSQENSASELLDYFASGKDIYIRQAALTYGVPESQVTKTQRQTGGKVPCIAEGQLVLTPRGLVPIEQVEKSDKVWDGVCWRSHDGVVFKGVKEVWEYDGLVATEDHVVYTQDRRTLPFGLCAREQIPLAKTGSGWQAIRLGDGGFTFSPLARRSGQARSQIESATTASAVPGLRHDQMDRHAQFADRQNIRLPSLLATTTNTEMARSPVDSGETPLREPKLATLCQLRRARHRISIRECRVRWPVDQGEHWLGKTFGAGPDRQQWALRPGQSALGDAQATSTKHAPNEDTRDADVAESVFEIHDEAYAAGRHDTAGYLGGGAESGSKQAQKLARYRGKARVYDIVNAGPLHRFTVSNVLVHNCLSFGFLGGAGAIMRMARAYGVEMDEATAEMLKRAWRESNPWAMRFGNNIEIAMYQAIRRPETVHTAGRVAYMCANDVLWCLLPSGRPLAYPFPEIIVEPNQWGEDREVVTCIKGSFHPKKGTSWWPRMRLWCGLGIENVTQATAADILRWALRELNGNGWPVIGHTHDEALLEIEVEEALEAAAVLRDVMTSGPAWAAGLPLLADISMGHVYGQGRELKFDKGRVLQ